MMFRARRSVLRTEGLRHYEDHMTRAGHADVHTPVCGLHTVSRTFYMFLQHENVNAAGDK